MAITKKEIKAEGYYNFTYDPDSKEFKECLEGYLEMMDATADEDDLLKNAAHQLKLRGDSSSMLEGIGYIKHKGKIKGEPYSGIEVEDDDPSYEYEVQ